MDLIKFVFDATGKYTLVILMTVLGVILIPDSCLGSKALQMRQDYEFWLYVMLLLCVSFTVIHISSKIRSCYQQYRANQKRISTFNSLTVEERVFILNAYENNLTAFQIPTGSTLIPRLLAEGYLRYGIPPEMWDNGEMSMVYNLSLSRQTCDFLETNFKKLSQQLESDLAKKR